MKLKKQKIIRKRALIISALFLIYETNAKIDY